MVALTSNEKLSLTLFNYIICSTKSAFFVVSFFPLDNQVEKFFLELF